MTGFCQTIQQSTCVVTGQRPNGVTNYASIDRIPAVLAALLAVLGVAVLGQFIVVSGRRRRRDFAILKALGMLRRQVSAITAWQVSTLTGLALLAGLPLGVAAGPVELGAVRPRPGYPRRRHHADLAGAAHGARSDRHRQRGRVLARPGNRAAEPSGGAARRVAPSGPDKARPPCLVPRPLTFARSCEANAAVGRTGLLGQVTAIARRMRCRW